MLGQDPLVTDARAFRAAIHDREALLSTGIGLGVAVPHVKIRAVKDFVIAVARVADGLEFDAIDRQPVRLVFMIGASEDQAASFVQVLARVVRLVKDDDRRERLIQSKIPDDFLNIVRAASLGDSSLGAGARGTGSLGTES